MKRKYYKTGELSKIYKLGRDSIKYYEKLGLLNPTRDTNSYRMYTIKDICNLNLIRELRTLDFSMQRKWYCWNFKYYYNHWLAWYLYQQEKK